MASQVKHPGQFVREAYLEPRQINVTEAAKLIGISRPGVSNFLNGRVATTSDMAVRIERAFGIPASTLLEMQAAFDASKVSSVPAGIKTYVPPFLAVKANDLESWADHNIPSRIRLAVFLRTLVHSTGLGLEKVDFPGNDDAERPGWDGFTCAASGTPWIPVGDVGWEFGVTGNIKSKADGDFAKSVKAYKKKSDRENITFVFVTPRRWPGKTDWQTDMRAKRQWKDVRAYDASDLEQWLEQSLAGQAWFANETERPSHGVRSLDRCWKDWADVATPKLVGALFDAGVGTTRSTLSRFVNGAHAGNLVIAADSTEEALAYLSRIFAEPEFEAARDRVLVFDQPGVFPRLAQGSQPFIPVIHTRDVERELGPYAKTFRSIIIYPRNATNSDPHITLDPLGYEAFSKALETMGCTRDEITRLAAASGRSLTVLRRQLATVEAVRVPEWADNAEISIGLVPLMLAGAWNASNEADCIALSMLADLPFEDIERRCQQLSKLNDAPVWLIGNYRGVVSKIDALFAIAPSITRSELNRYIQTAKMILGEDDPALDLPDKDRWAASIHGKRRDFSAALREGISETLVLLSVHGRHLFKTRLNFDGEYEAIQVVRELLTPVTTRKLEANDSDLPLYAEAAPDTFLEILEEDLKRESPAVMGVLRPVDTSFFGASCMRTGLLWALEGLAWNPETFLRSVLILARLAEVEINDNWANKPIASLESIFRCWMPQTAADHDRRLKAIHLLIERFPEIGWRICVHQFGGFGHDVGDYSHKPKWRQDGSGYGEPFEFMEPVHKFRLAMVELALKRPAYTPQMLCDLVSRLHGLDTFFQARVWDIIEDWAVSAADEDIGVVREKIRVSVLSRRSRRSSGVEGFAKLSAKARQVYEILEPKNLLAKHEWLFRQAWVDESADELGDENLDYQAREKRISELRCDALRAILKHYGTKGIFDLATKGSAQHQIGWHMVNSILAEDAARDFVFQALQTGSVNNASGSKALIAGAILAMAKEQRIALFGAAKKTLPEGDVLRLLLLSNYDRTTWEFVDQMQEGTSEAYWRDVHPYLIFEPDEEANNESVERLLHAQRPRAAFAAVHFKLEVIRPRLIVDMLVAMARGGEETDKQYQLQEYDLKAAFKLLSKNPDVPLEEKAGLELAYIEILGRLYGDTERNCIPNLERYLEDHPELYLQALVWAYRRKDRGEDPPEFRVPAGREDLAKRGYRLLESIQRIPGQQLDNTYDQSKLRKWIDGVRETSVTLDRADVCDLCLGKLFSHAPIGADGVWPCEDLRDVIESLQSRTLADGIRSALYNARGVHWRGEGGEQERELAAKYRGWADALQFTHPFLSSAVLMGMVKTYEREADDQDTEAGIRRRMRY